MALVNPYLHFRGNTEEAFTFYKNVFGVEFIRLVRFKDMPASDDYQVPDMHLDKIMYVSMPLGKSNYLMGSDAILESTERPFTMGDNFHIAISAESKEEADKLFNGLAPGARIDMPMGMSPWGAYFGMLMDQYGVQWTVEFDAGGEAEANK